MHDLRRALVIQLLVAGLGFTLGCSDGTTAPTRKPAQKHHDAGVVDDEDAGAEAPNVTTFPSGIPGLASIWGTAADDIWAVGEAGAIVHYDGKSWTRVASGTAQDLVAVHGSAPNEVWAAGDDVVVHWDGSDWTVELSGILETLLGVWVNGPRDVWIVGITQDTNVGILRHYDGQGWDALTLNTRAIWKIWASGPNDIWFGGSAADGSGFLARGDGMAFDQVDYGGGSLRAITGFADDDLWVAPYESSPEHWDGTSWTTPDADFDDMSRLSALSGVDPNDVWSVGLRGLILHWNGTRWSSTPGVTDATLSGVWAAAHDNVWVVGAAVLHWNGERWSTLRTF